MHLLDWMIVIPLLCAVIAITLVSRKYMTSVSDFLTARRGAGRYLLAVASGEAALGLFTFVASLESSYISGFAVSPFWGRITSMVMIILALTGYCVYRFRETRAMTMGQFLEMRYNRAFRVYAAVLQAIAGVVNYAIVPAVSARALIYFCDLPMSFEVGGFYISTYMLMMALLLAFALFIVLYGGQISIMITDCLQGIMSYPFYMIVVLYLALRFSFFDEILPVLADRNPGESMLNPYDTTRLRDFNLFYVFVGLVAAILNYKSWNNAQGYTVAARNAHEQKMAGVLSMWRSGFSIMMYVIVGVVVYFFFHAAHTQIEAAKISHDLIEKVSVEVSGKPYTELTGKELPQGTANEILAQSYEEVKAIDAKQGQTFRSIFNQMRGIMTIKYLLPTGLLGLMCAIMFFLIISCDTTCIHSWGSVIVQDVILPLLKKPLSPTAHLLLLRLMMVAVALFSFMFSVLFAQFDYLYMFFAITSAIWLGGAGPCIVFGLYWKRGTSAGAFAALTSGTVIAVAGFVMQGLWVKHLYPALAASDYLGIVSRIVETVSRPLEPLVLWRINPDSFPFNSQEIYFFAMLISTILYIVVSLATSKNRVFNMDKMLHRGQYRVEGAELAKQEWTFKGVCRTLVGIDSEYTKGDRILAWSVFYFSIVWGMGTWIVAVIWNAIDPWPIEWWGTWFFYFNYIQPTIIGVASTFWFFFGGIHDLRAFFAFLKSSSSDVNEDGRVS